MVRTEAVPNAAQRSVCDHVRVCLGGKILEKQARIELNLGYVCMLFH